MDFSTLRDFLALLGTLVVVVGAALFGSFGFVVVQNALGRWLHRCRYDYREDPPYCVTHMCGAYDQCGLVECPHCVYKCDDEMLAYGYPFIHEGKRLYAGEDGCYTLPNGECIAPDCALHDRCTVGAERAPGWYCTRAQGHDGPCAMVPLFRCAPDADPSNPANYTHTNYNTGEPCPPDCGTRIRIRRLKPENIEYRMGADGHLTDLTEYDDEHNVVAEFHEPLPTVLEDWVPEDDEERPACD